jgi:hypothetical protein
VIVGGGFGGLYTAKVWRRAPVKVTLVDGRNFHIGFENNLLVMFQWGGNYCTRTRGAQLITGKDLFPLIEPRTGAAVDACPPGPCDRVAAKLDSL